MAMKKGEKKEATPSVYLPQAEDVAQQKKAGATPSGKTVVVALCHPHGIQFLLDEGKRRIVLNGNAANLKGQAMGKLPLGGFGLTEIPAADWEAIKHTYGSMEIFKNGLCFAHEVAADTMVEADEKAELRHGREPVQVEGPDKQSKSESITPAAM